MKLLIILPLLFGCVTRRQLNGKLWLNNTPIPSEICEREPALKDYGLYRRLDTGGFEFISFCDAKANKFIAIHKDELARLLNEQESDSKAAIKVLR